MPIIDAHLHIQPWHMLALGFAAEIASGVVLLRRIGGSVTR